MPPKERKFFKPKSKGKAKASEPRSENDFLSAADDFEQAAGKWRAGDAAKAGRFFQRAIDMYNEGLKRHPSSFDLAYNKANLEYNIIEDKRIQPQLGNETELLRRTLDSHRFALSLNPANLDILFNTAQVLAALAEGILEGRLIPMASFEERSSLEEAVEIFTRCLDGQQQEYAQMQTEIAAATASGEYNEAWESERPRATEDRNDEEMEDSSISSETPGDWATVEAPLTPETMLETCTAQLDALTILIHSYDPKSDLPAMEKAAQVGIEIAGTKVPTLIDLVDKSPSLKAAPEPQPGLSLSVLGGPAAVDAVEATTGPKDEATLAVANFQVRIAEMKYQCGNNTSTRYAQTVEQTFGPLIKGVEEATTLDLASINMHSAYADALIDLASTLADGEQYNAGSSTFTTDVEIQWTALTQAQSNLTRLSAAPYTSILSANRLMDIYLARGDTELFRHRISCFEVAKPAWTKSKPVLLANAGVFYRGALSYAEKAKTSDENLYSTKAKAVIAEMMNEMAGGAKSVTSRDGLGLHAKYDPRQALMHMATEGMISKNVVEELMPYFQY